MIVGRFILFWQMQMSIQFKLQHGLKVAGRHDLCNWIIEWSTCIKLAISM